MKRLAAVTTLLCILILAVGVFFFVRINDTEDATGGYAVRLNEIENMARDGDAQEAADAAKDLREQIRSEAVVDRKTDYTPLVMSGICAVFLAGTCVYWYLTVIKPFAELTEFAEKVGGGDLDTPLPYKRGGLFGKFTWALDSMRGEVKKARSCEQEAIENNKTVIATLSHDIKTPIATIGAYAEALDMGMDIDPEKRSRYVETILKKCDEVKFLTEDMLTHALTELGHLKMEPEVFELGSLIEELVSDLNADKDDIKYKKPAYSLEVDADKKRISQVLENLISNSRKYAKTDMHIELSRKEDRAEIKFSDKGGGIPDEDMPFVQGKFYRGKNTGNEQGAGLGLFIVKYIVEQSGGVVTLRNADNGLLVTVTLPLFEEKQTS